VQEQQVLFHRKQACWLWGMALPIQPERQKQPLWRQ
jgi:hypothetical protein